MPPAVFLQQQFAEFRQKESEEKMVDILRKVGRSTKQYRVLQYKSTALQLMSERMSGCEGDEGKGEDGGRPAQGG